MRTQIFAVFVLLVGLIAAPARSNPLQCSLMPQLFDLFLKRHYQYHTLTDELKQRTVDQFIKSELDPSKSLLLDEDVAKLKKNLLALFQTMGSGNCNALDEVGKLLVMRATETKDFVTKFLGPSYKFSDNIELTLDPRKRAYPKTQAEKQDYLVKMIQFQMSNLLDTKIKTDDAKKQLVHRYELLLKRLTAKKREDLLNNFAEAFAQGLDPHSDFLSKDNLEEFEIQMQLSLEGIGASLSNQDGFTVIEELIPGGSADRSKLLKPKDKIMAVAQDGKAPQSILDMDLKDVVKLIRGPKGTKVTLTILRQSETPKTFVVTIKRDKIDIKDQAAKITYDKRTVNGKTYKIGVLDLPSFYGGGGGANSRWSFRDVKQLLLEAKKEKVDGIALDLSRNGGGLLEEAVQITGLFIQKGGVVATKDTDQKVQVLSDDDEGVVWNGPLVVLTSRLSASASEILAGALKNYHRGLIVGGDHTFGKGSVQALSSLPLDLGGMKVTTGMFFLPGGKSTQDIGVVSDIRLPSPLDGEDIGENTLDYALPPQNIKAFLSSDANTSDKVKHWTAIDDAIVKSLTEKSEARVKKDSKFAEILKANEDAKKEHGIIKLAEVRKKSKEEEKKDKSLRKKAQDKDKELEAPLTKEGENILADLCALEEGKQVTSNQ